MPNLLCIISLSLLWSLGDLAVTTAISPPSPRVPTVQAPGRPFTNVSTFPSNPSLQVHFKDWPDRDVRLELENFFQNIQLYSQVMSFLCQTINQLSPSFKKKVNKFTFFLENFPTCMIFVAEIVHEANIFMSSNFATHENLCMLCGGKLFNMKSNFAPHVIVNIILICAVLEQNLFCCDLYTFVWSKNQPENLVCGAKKINIIYVSTDWRQLKKFNTNSYIQELLTFWKRLKETQLWAISRWNYGGLSFYSQLGHWGSSLYNHNYHNKIKAQNLPKSSIFYCNVSIVYLAIQNLGKLSYKKNG